MSERIANYEPRARGADWEAVSEFVRVAIATTDPDPASLKALFTAVPAHVRWCWLGGHPLDATVIFDRYLIESFIAGGAPRTWSPSTRATMRSYLFRASRALLGTKSNVPVRFAPLPTSTAHVPYQPREIASMVRWANAQPSQQHRRDTMVLLALSLGAGLTGEDLAVVTVGDVSRSRGCVVISVPGRRNRDVALLCDWEDTVANAATGDPAAFLFRPNRTTASRNTVSNFLTAIRPDPPLNLYRLRATWIVKQLSAGTPLPTLVRAAGLAHLESLDRFLPFVDRADLVDRDFCLLRCAP